MILGKMAVALVAVILAVGGLAAISSDDGTSDADAGTIAMADDDRLGRKSDGDDAIDQVDDDDDDKKKAKKKGRNARGGGTDSRSRDGTRSRGNSRGATTSRAAGGARAGGGAASVSYSAPPAGGGTSYSGYSGDGSS